jgi:hypothetical protein
MLTTLKVIAIAQNGSPKMMCSLMKLPTAWPKTACSITAFIEEMYNSINVKSLSWNGKLKLKLLLWKQEKMFAREEVD